MPHSINGLPDLRRFNFTRNNFQCSQYSGLVTLFLSFPLSNGRWRPYRSQLLQLGLECSLVFVAAKFAGCFDESITLVLGLPVLRHDALAFFLAGLRSRLRRGFGFAFCSGAGSFGWLRDSCFSDQPCVCRLKIRRFSNPGSSISRPRIKFSRHAGPRSHACFQASNTAGTPK